MEKVKQVGSVAVFVDIDNTIIKGTTLKILAQSFLARRRITVTFFMRLLYWYYQYKRNKLNDFSNVLSHAFEQTVSWDFHDTNILIRQCFEEKMKPRIFVTMEKRLREHHRKGHTVYFVSSTILPIAELFTEYFGFGIPIVTEPEVRGDAYTGDIIGDVCYGKKKRERLMVFLGSDVDLTESYAYTDHISDLPMLELVGYPVVVNPGKRLTAIAQQYHWKILNIRKVRGK